MGINKLLTIIPTPNDFNVKMTASVFNYIMHTEDACRHVESMLSSRSTDEIMHTSRAGNLIKELVSESADLVQSDDIPLYYDMLNCALELVDYDWIARTIYFSLYPEKLEELERK